MCDCSTETPIKTYKAITPCSWRVRDSRWWGSLTMVPAGNKAKRLSSQPYHKNNSSSSSSSSFLCTNFIQVRFWWWLNRGYLFINTAVILLPFLKTNSLKPGNSNSVFSWWQSASSKFFLQPKQYCLPLP